MNIDVLGLHWLKNETVISSLSKDTKNHDLILMGKSLIMGDKLENQCVKYTDK
jgi:hypothetical protein